MHLFGEVEHGQAYETVRCSMLTQLRNMFLHPFRPGPHRGPTTSTRAFRQVENLIRSEFTDCGDPRHFESEWTVTELPVIDGFYQAALDAVRRERLGIRTEARKRSWVMSIAPWP